MSIWTAAALKSWSVPIIVHNASFQWSWPELFPCWSYIFLFYKSYCGVFCSVLFQTAFFVLLSQVFVLSSALLTSRKLFGVSRRCILFPSPLIKKRKTSPLKTSMTQGYIHLMSSLMLDFPELLCCTLLNFIYIFYLFIFYVGHFGNL